MLRRKKLYTLSKSLFREKSSNRGLDHGIHLFVFCSLVHQSLNRSATSCPSRRIEDACPGAVVMPYRWHERSDPKARRGKVRDYCVVCHDVRRMRGVFCYFGVCTTCSQTIQELKKSTDRLLDCNEPPTFFQANGATA